MKGILLYKGKYGATRQYANWIGEELQWPVFPSDELQPEKLDDADIIVIGSSVYAGRLLLNSWLKQHASQLINKKLLLFIVCATPADKTDVLNQIAKLNIPPVLREQCNVFFLRGRVVIKDLSWGDKLMLKMASWGTKDPVEKRAMVQGFDAVKKENIIPLVKAVKAMLIAVSDKVISEQV
jgi:menaquinone-dependent protoporphyrinogen IX oxidase